MTEQEKQFYQKDFSFSYSSLNKLLFSPSLFYKDYILNEREVRTDKHLIEGKLLHCLLFEPENLQNKFKIIPDKTPSDSVVKVLKSLYNKVGDADLLNPGISNEVLNVLQEQNLYQSIKDDSKRLEKIQNSNNLAYWEFMQNPNVDVVDLDTVAKSKERVEILLNNKEIKELLSHKPTDFELDPIQVFVEKALITKLKDKKFGLKGIVDFFMIDDDKQEVTICDLKTTSKSISDFKETVEYYNYWLQASIYSKLVYDNVSDKVKDYTFTFKFAVIDTYDQTYLFEVSKESLNQWASALENIIEIADYHYTNNDYSLPYEFNTKVML